MSKHPSAAPSTRTRVRRIPELANYDRQSLYRILDTAYVCHIAFNDGENTHCIPTACWRTDDYLYIHGSNGSRLIKALIAGAQAAIAITHLDGLVLARSAFSHSMNYRSAVIYGLFEQIKGNAKKMHAMDALMQKIAHGRQHEARPGNEKELAATSVLRISLDEAVAKISSSAPVDKQEDIDLPVWAGILPLIMMQGEPIPADDNKSITTPGYVTTWLKTS